METVRKQTRTQADPVEGELAAINALGNTSLTAEEVYPFGVRLCDNQTDRDLEYFARADLEQLAALFVERRGSLTTAGAPRTSGPGSTARNWWRSPGWSPRPGSRGAT